MEQDFFSIIENPLLNVTRGEMWRVMEAANDYAQEIEVLLANLAQEDINPGLYLVQNPLAEDRRLLDERVAFLN